MKISIINKFGSGERKIREAIKTFTINRSQAIFSFQKTEPATYLSGLNINYKIN